MVYLKMKNEKFTTYNVHIFILILYFLMVLAPLPVDAATTTSSSNFEKAVDLKILGLFANSPDKFELNRAPTRLEGAIMLIRLLGKEQQVKQGQYTHPFRDVPAWADRYVGYMYESNLSNGVGDSKFGSDDKLSASQYITFVLRAFGYQDNKDFHYKQVLDKALSVGLISSSEKTSLESSSVFLRNDLVAISYNALSVKMKESSQTLLDKLINTDKAIFKPAAYALGLYTSDIKEQLEGITTFHLSTTSKGQVVKTNEDLYKVIGKCLYSYENKLNIDISNYNGKLSSDFDKVFNRAKDIVEDITGVHDFVRSWEYLSENGSLKITFEYRYSKAVYNEKYYHVKAALNKARNVVAKLISKDMTDFEKEKLLHDYIINNTKYDYENYKKDTLPDESFEEYGCLVLGIAVCEGYSEAMKLMCDLSGIECIIVNGKSINNGTWEGHSWNIVRIDGAYYHIDVTNDDPVAEDGSNLLTYYYFNIPDNEMAKSNTWNKADYPACTTVKSSYYYKNNMVAGTKAAFDKAVQQALTQRRPIIELKVLDYTKGKYSNISDIVFKSDSVLKYRFTVNDEFGIIRIFNILYS